MANVEKLHPGKENVFRAVGLLTAKKYLERQIQLLYPMELHCNTVRNTETKLNPNVEEFRPSLPKRTTAAVAKVKFEIFNKRTMAFDHYSNGGGELCRNSRDLVTILIFGRGKMSNIPREKLA